MISVVIPVYNREHLIARAIESVVAQSLAAGEIIVVDDASTDRTAEVVVGIGERVSTVTLVCLKENVGAAKARNIGIENAKGDLIAFLDSDDVWYPEKLSKQIIAFEENNDVVAVFCGLVVDNPDTGRRTCIMPKAEISVENLFHYNILMTMSCAMVRRSVLSDIGGFDELLPPCEDWDLFIRLAEVGRLSVVQETLVGQPAHEGPKISRDSQRVLAGFDAIFEKIYARISDPSLMRKVRASYEMRMADILSADYCFDPLRAITHSCKALLLRPSPNALNNLRHVMKKSCKNLFSDRCEDAGMCRTVSGDVDVIE
jgi:glycosyltransferase involved in cell wall biosynthesis